jgi:hypothetical protein
MMMTHSPPALPGSIQSPVASILHRIAAQQGISLGWIDDARRAATPYIVDCDGLTRANPTQPGEFEGALRERRDWCEANARGDYEIEPIGPNPEELTGRRFRFANDKVAALFKTWFPIDLWP